MTSDSIRKILVATAAVAALSVGACSKPADKTDTNNTTTTDTTTTNTTAPGRRRERDGPRQQHHHQHDGSGHQLDDDHHHVELDRPISHSPSGSPEAEQIGAVLRGGPFSLRACERERRVA